MSSDPILGRNIDPRTSPSESVQPGRRRVQAAGEPEAGHAVDFRALLDRLSEQARRLERERESVRDSGGLSSAVERARETALDAIALSDRLLEACRQAALCDRRETGKEGRP